MSFLHRRRSFIPAQPPASPPQPLPPLPVENISTSQPSTISSRNGKGSRPTSLIRRVSSLFSNRRKRPPSLVPFSKVSFDSRRNIGVEQGSQSPTSSDVSEDDIRRPSGLGRAASISSNRSLPPSPFTAIDEESPFHVATNKVHERVRAVSSPNLLRSMTGKLQSGTGRRMSFIVKRVPVPAMPPLVPHIPAEVLVVIISFLPRGATAHVAAVSRDFCSAARTVVYGTLDMRNVHPDRLESLFTLLAPRRDLTDLIRHFECYTWPPFFAPSGSVACASHFSPALAATFTVAFQHMHNLTSLVLPSFDYAFLRHHSAFGLKKLTFLNRTISTVERTQLFTWLNGQTNITHLTFPKLEEPNDTPSHTDTPNGLSKPCNTLSDSRTTNILLAPSPNISPTCSPASPLFPFTPIFPVSPFNSPALLPALTTIHTIPSIIAALFGSGPVLTPRPLINVTININTTLYRGLRPGALMTPLQGVLDLSLRFGPAVDRRTIGKVLSATATALAGDGLNDTETQGLKVLQIELASSDEAFYKVINTVLPRFHGLSALMLRSSSPQGNEEQNVVSMVPVLSDSDHAYIKLFVKHCSSLQSILLLSGAVWQSPG